MPPRQSRTSHDGRGCRRTPSYASVGRTPELVLAVIDMVLGGADEPVPPDQRDDVQAVRTELAARGKIEIYAAAVARLVPSDGAATGSPA
jgi:hypothetical protein